MQRSRAALGPESAVGGMHIADLPVTRNIPALAMICGLHLVVWVDRREEPRSLWASIVTVQTASVAFRVSPPGVFAQGHAVATDGTGFLVAWEQGQVDPV